MEPRPDAELAQPSGQVVELGAPALSTPFPGLIAQVEPVSGCVLSDHQQFLDPTSDQGLRLSQHLSDRP